MTARAPAAILWPMSVAGASATWWSYADGNRTALAVVVVVVSLAAAAYVGGRVVGAVRARKRR